MTKQEDPEDQIQVRSAPGIVVDFHRFEIDIDIACQDADDDQDVPPIELLFFEHLGEGVDEKGEGYPYAHVDRPHLEIDEIDVHGDDKLDQGE